MTLDPLASAPSLDRRRFLGLGAGAAALVALAACGGDDSTATGGASDTTAAAGDPMTEAPSGGWTFTDDRGVTVTLAAPPQRIVAYVGTAAVLWDFGVRPIGVFGPLLNEDGTPQAAAGRIDVNAVESAGDGWDGANLEALAALKPDLVVTGGVQDPWVISGQMDAVAKIAPIAVIEVYNAPASGVLDNYERFAVATGIDPGNDTLVAARAAYEDARGELQAAIASKPGLTTLVTYADTEGLYIANPSQFPDLLELESLGLDLVDPPPTTDYFEQLSWEAAGKYPSDLILHDVRSFSLQPDVLAEDQPTWNILPAVEAGQIGSWSAEAILSYQGLTDVYQALTATISATRADVV